MKDFGLSIPKQYHGFPVVSNWPRVVVDTIADRQRVRSVILGSEEDLNPRVREVLDRNDFDTEFNRFNVTRLVTGRGYMSVGRDAAGHAVIRSEPASELAALRDPVSGLTTAAARFVGARGPVSEHQVFTPAQLQGVQLYTEDAVYYFVPGNPWRLVREVPHTLGYCPVQYYPNRSMSSGATASLRGGSPPEYESEIEDIAPLADAAARALTNLQFAQAAAGAPFRWIAGVTEDDMRDDSGELVSKFEAYFGALQLLRDHDAKVGELKPSDLQNFRTALEAYGAQASIVTGFPSRYFGHFTANPPNEASMKADEAVLVRRVERQNVLLGPFVARVAALAYMLETGDTVDPRLARTDWYDASTPTEAQRSDALLKQRQAGALSVEGYLVELGWSPERIAQEMLWLRREAEDALTLEVTGGIKAALRGSDEAAADRGDGVFGGVIEDAAGA